MRSVQLPLDGNGMFTIGRRGKIQDDHETLNDLGIVSPPVIDGDLHGYIDAVTIGRE